MYLDMVNFLVLSYWHHISHRTTDIDLYIGRQKYHCKLLITFVQYKDLDMFALFMNQQVKKVFKLGEYLLALLIILLSAQCITLRNRNLLHFSPPYADSFAITSLWIIQGQSLVKQYLHMIFPFFYQLNFLQFQAISGSNEVTSDIREETFHQLQPRRTLPKGKSVIIRQHFFQPFQIPLFQMSFSNHQQTVLGNYLWQRLPQFFPKKVGIKNITHEAFHQQRQ